jgi:hypothetical protein
VRESTKRAKTEEAILRGANVANEGEIIERKIKKSRDPVTGRLVEIKEKKELIEKNNVGVMEKIDDTLTTTTAQWISLTLFLGIASLFIAITFAGCSAAAVYYYGGMTWWNPENNASALFYDRIMFAIIALLAYYASWRFVQGALEILRQYGTRVYLSDDNNAAKVYSRTVEAALSDAQKSLDMELGDYAGVAWEWLKGVTNLRVIFTGLCWGTFEVVELFCRTLFYVTLVGIVAATLLNAMNVPFSYAPSTDSKIFGPFVSVLDRYAGLFWNRVSGDFAIRYDAFNRQPVYGTSNIPISTPNMPSTPSVFPTTVATAAAAPSNSVNDIIKQMEKVEQREIFGV